MTAGHDEQRPMSGGDGSIDRLLRGALQARPGNTAAGVCLDADLLAAWADDALDARERAAAEAHVADCSRCQALLAAMVRTLPPEAGSQPTADRAGQRRWWRLPAIEWLVPLTAAAAALAIWIAVPARAPVQVSDPGTTAVDQGASPSASPRSLDPGQVDPGAAARLQQPAPAETSRRERQPIESSQSASDLRLERQAEASREKAARPAETGSRADAVGTPTTAAAAAPTPVQQAPAAATGAAAAATPAPAARSAFTDATTRNEAIAPQRRVMSAGLETVVVSSNPSTRFRLLRGGGVQRSADGGATWRDEVTGVPDTLTAGASPSPSVCWLVGPSGIVVLSTDGRSWRRLAFPEAVELRSVSASDGENATVTTADGRAFVTTDAGRSWVRSGGL